MAYAGARRARQTVLEVQFHPSDIRWRVRTLFLARRQVAAVVGAAALAGAFVLANLAVAPRVVRELMLRDRYLAGVEERSAAGRELEDHTARLTVLEGRAAELRRSLARIYLTYGLEADAAAGQGGFPFAERPVPESIYATAVSRANAAEARLAQEVGVLGTFLEEVRSFEAINGERVTTTPSLSPVRDEFVLTSPFGQRVSPFTKQPDFHAGIDLAASIGARVHAPADGVVVFAGRYPLRQDVAWWRYGNLVAVRHGIRFVTVFGHCNEVLVRAGQRVAQGEALATVGNTGWSTSPHLHYEVRLWEEARGAFVPVDPRIYILDHRWRDEEQLLIRARQAPSFQEFEPLPRVIGGS
ncbi:MAG: M23 family metallopeptidase [Thermoanaerobaculia bacterium]